MDSTPKGSILLAAAIAAVAFAVYSPSLGYGFIWDDHAIIENPSIQGLDLGHITRFFTDRNAYHAPGEIYRPLYLFTFAVDYALYGTSPRGWHLTNILLHCLSAALVFIFLSELFRGLKGWPALFGAALYAVHPIHTESVAWIKARDDILALIFMLFSLLFYMRHVRAKRPRRNYILSLVFFVPALLSKEMALGLPFLFILHDLCFDRGHGSWKRRAAAYLPFLVMAGLFVVLRTAVLGAVAQMTYLGGGFGPAMYTTARAVARYLYLIVLPVGQCGDYLAFGISYRPDITVVLSALLVAAVFAAGVLYFIYRATKAAFFIFWFFIALLPVSNIVPVKIPLAERFLYIPSLGAFALGGLALARIGSVKGRSAERVLLAVPFLVIGLYSGATLHRLPVWKNEFTFWADVIEKYPSARAYTNYGLAFEEAGRIEEAIEYYKSALRMDPRFSYALNNLGANYLKLGLVDRALAAYGEAVRLEPDNPVMLIGLGDALKKKGLLKEAAASYLRALEAHPENPDARERLAGVFIEMGMMEEAAGILSGKAR